MATLIQVRTRLRDLRVCALTEWVSLNVSVESRSTAMFHLHKVV